MPNKWTNQIKQKQTHRYGKQSRCCQRGNSEKGKLGKGVNCLLMDNSYFFKKKSLFILQKYSRFTLVSDVLHRDSIFF